MVEYRNETLILKSALSGTRECSNISSGIYTYGLHRGIGESIINCLFLTLSESPLSLMFPASPFFDALVRTDALNLNK